MNMMGKAFITFFYTTLAINIYMLARFTIYEFYTKSGFSPLFSMVKENDIYKSWYSSTSDYSFLLSQLWSIFTSKHGKLSLGCQRKPRSSLRRKETSHLSR
jgi:hypothetical protein